LHGNANKKEKSPDGGDDKNVFDIKQGVSIFFGIKKKNLKSKETKIFRADCFGTRELKFKFLDSHSLDSVKWGKMIPSAPNYEWVIHDSKIQTEFRNGFTVTEIFPVSTIGIVTSRDNFVIDFDKVILKKRIINFLSIINPKDALTKFELKENTKWKASNALKHDFNEQNIVPVSYRPFDSRFV